MWMGWCANGWVCGGVCVCIDVCIYAVLYIAELHIIYRMVPLE